MKKLISLIAAFGMVTSTGATVVSCAQKTTEVKPEENKIVDLENDTNLVKSILAGNMDENGIINAEKGIKETAITEKSILTSFNWMNTSNLSNEDVQIKQVANTKKYKIEAKADSKRAIGATTIDVNQNIDSATVLKNTNIGNMYVAKGIFDQQRKFFDGDYIKQNGGSENNSNSEFIKTNENTKIDGNPGYIPYTFAMQNAGVANPLIEYLKSDLFIGAMEIIGKANDIGIEKNVFLDKINVNLAWVTSLSGVFANTSKTTTFDFELKEENRIVFGEHIKDSKENKIKLNKTIYNSKNKKNIVENIYSQMDEQFKKTVSIEELVNFSKIHYSNDDAIPSFEIIPGGQNLYGMDDLAPFAMQIGGYKGTEYTVGKYKPAQTESGNLGYEITLVD